MTKVIADISMSLDGLVTGPDPDIEHGLGRGGEALHAWALESSSEVDAEVLREAVEATGAVVMGRRLFRARVADRDPPHLRADERVSAGQRSVSQQAPGRRCEALLSTGDQGPTARSSERPASSRDHWAIGRPPGHTDTGGQAGGPPSVRVEHCCGQPGGRVLPRLLASVRGRSRPPHALHSRGGSVGRFSQ
jgi:hypothetical protein